jgi:transcriptional regulator with XRE-family HTH domain
MAAHAPLAAPAGAGVGALLRGWRQRRRLSQLDLAGDADVSTRHLSFVETGRAMPSREMVLRLADRLEVPLRERNRLLTAAGYAPMFAERGLDAAGNLKAFMIGDAKAMAAHWTENGEYFADDGTHPATRAETRWTHAPDHVSSPAALAGDGHSPKWP